MCDIIKMTDISNYIPSELINIIRQFYANNFSECYQLYNLTNCLDEKTKCLYCADDSIDALMYYDSIDTLYLEDEEFKPMLSDVPHFTGINKLTLTSFYVGSDISDSLYTLRTNIRCCISEDVISLPHLIELKLNATLCANARTQIFSRPHYYLIDRLAKVCPNITTLTITVNSQAQLITLTNLKFLKYLTFWSEPNFTECSIAVFHKNKYLRCLNVIGNSFVDKDIMKITKFSVAYCNPIEHPSNPNITIYFASEQNDNLTLYVADNATKYEIEYLLDHKCSTKNIQKMHYKNFVFNDITEDGVMLKLAELMEDKKWINDKTCLD
jgi:hypothetical protein